MSERVIDDPETNPEWVLKFKKRLPRHQDPPDEHWFLDQSVKPAYRWLAAEQDMLNTKEFGCTSKMEDAFAQIRLDIGMMRCAWNPQKYTTMVQGRPVQVE